MGTVFKLVFFAGDDSTAARASRAVFARVDTLNALFSDYLPESELNRLCAKSGTGEKVPVSQDLWRILRLSKKYAQMSDGAFDVTIGPLTRLWRRARNLKEVPDSTRIAVARDLVGYESLSFFKHPHRVRLEKTGMKLDLGGIAQGYAADECLKILRSFGIHRALADAGGDIALGNAPPGAKGWRIEVPPAFRRADLGLAYTDSTLVLHDCGVTVSSGQVRFLEANGRRYSHIIDPISGWAIQRPIMVLVQAPTAVEADALATALNVQDPGTAPPWAIKKPKVRFWRALYE